MENVLMLSPLHPPGRAFRLLRQGVGPAGCNGRFRGNVFAFLVLGAHGLGALDLTVALSQALDVGGGPTAAIDAVSSGVLPGDALEEKI